LNGIEVNFNLAHAPGTNTILQDFSTVDEALAMYCTLFQKIKPFKNPKESRLML
jgi:hypothetical protein